MQQVFNMTQMPMEVREQVWKIVNPKGLDVFDQRMFFMAIHFLYKAKQGNQIPPSIPQEIIFSLDPDGFIAHMMSQQNQMKQQQMQQQQQQLQQQQMQ
mmetsp:Transcript_20453/g.19436  ORF Transcript_20453/g.19436 Transcript_20453/m.19436 type:complete len:98 (-) Transcript_20453:76-369(-)